MQKKEKLKGPLSHHIPSCYLPFQPTLVMNSHSINCKMYVVLLWCQESVKLVKKSAPS